MKLLTGLGVAAVTTAFLAGCASAPATSTSVASTSAGKPAGRHLVYRDAAGAPIRQFDYPDDTFCRKVESVAGSSARCQSAPEPTGLGAQATLRYNPPGILVHAMYSDMARCRQETGTLGAGVELINGCATK